MQGDVFSTLTERAGLQDFKIELKKGKTTLVEKSGDKVEIIYERENQIYFALQYAALYQSKNEFKRVFEKPFELDFMLDCSRNAVMNTESIKRLIDILAKCGYDSLTLYMEDVFEIEYDEYFGHMRGRYSKEELREIVQYARQYGMDVRPCIQTLAHMNQYLKWRGSFELCDCEDILFCDNEKTYIFLENIIKSLSDIFPCPRFMIGMDEARLLGAGKYYDKYGYVERKTIFLKHLGKVADILRKYGKIGLIWSDSLFSYLKMNYFEANTDERVPDSVVHEIPENIELIYWNYGQEKTEVFERKIIQHKQFGRAVYCGGSTIGPSNISPMNDLAVKYLSVALEACKKSGVAGYGLYHWGDDGAELSVFSVLPSVCFCSAFCYGIDYKKLFFAITGIEIEQFMLLDKMNRPYGNYKKYENDIAEYFKNVSKYCLYNDVLLGLCDANISLEYSLSYAATSDLLKKINAGDYQYIFDTQIALAQLLEKKSTAGILLKEAYEKKDKTKLERCVLDLENIIQLTERFAQVYQKQWLKDNKPFGLEIFHQRIGGMLYRLRYAIEKIQAYTKNEIDRIEELEEKRLSFDKNLPEGKPEIPFALFTNIISANKI